MSFENIKQLATGTAEINIEGNIEKVRLLKIHEREYYDKLVNEGFGTIQANLGSNSQKANMNIVKVTDAQKRAEHYLIRQSFSETGEISEEDIDELYNIYEPLVKELKRVNGIIDVDNQQLVDSLSSELESEIKK